MLSDRAANEAYLAADPGRAYAPYFPADGEVQLDLLAARGKLVAHWINIHTGEFEQTAENSAEVAKQSQGGTKGGAESREITDHDLALIIAAWPRLRENVKAAIRAIVESATR